LETREVIVDVFLQFVENLYRLGSVIGKFSFKFCIVGLKRFLFMSEDGNLLDLLARFSHQFFILILELLHGTSKVNLVKLAH